MLQELNDNVGQPAAFWTAVLIHLLLFISSLTTLLISQARE